MSDTALYFLAIIPPEELREKVKALKVEMQNRFQAGHALKSPAHITLQMPFRRKKDAVPALVEELAKFAAQEAPFSVELSGFDVFAPKVLYVKVLDHSPIQRLHDHLQGFLLDRLAFEAREVNAEFHPHMTIATRDLTEAAFYRAWPEFEKRAFRATFMVESIFLLKHNGFHWEMYRKFGFTPNVIRKKDG